MKSHQTKKLYTLHSWLGVLSGVLMFVICFTGAVSVFGHEDLRKWANPDIRGHYLADPQVVEKLTADAATRVPEEYRDRVQINLPGTYYKDLVLVFESELKAEDGSGPLGYMLRYNMETQELLSGTEGVVRELYQQSFYSNAADYIVGFHTDLHLGKPGLILTGTLGLLLLASVVTGVVVHRKILAQLFTFRPQKSFSLMLNDGHKQLGVWGVLFHGVIGFTGAFLGLATVILLPAAAYVSFGGDQDKLVETFLTEEQPVLSQEYHATPVAHIIADSRMGGEQVVNFINVRGYNDANSITYVRVEDTEAMARGETRRYDSGEFTSQTGNFSRLDGASGALLELLFPLHFGNFGGVLVKALWTLLGLTTALLPLSGMMLWVERGMNASNPRFSKKTYDRFNRILLGSCGGVVLSCVAVFHGQLVVNLTQFSGDVEPIMSSIFYSFWLAGIGWALLMPKLKLAVQWMLKLTAIALLLLMPLNALITDSHVFNVVTTGHYTTAVTDVLFLLMGIALWRSVDKLKVTELPADSDSDPDLAAQQLKRTQQGA